MSDTPITLSTSTRKQVGPRRDWLAEKKLLQTKEHAQQKDFSAAQNRRARDFIGGDAFLAQFVRHQREGNAGEKQKQRRGKRPAQLRQLEKSTVARRAAQPGVVAMRLEHHQAGESSQPVDVGNSFCAFIGHQFVPLASRNGLALVECDTLSRHVR